MNNVGHASIEFQSDDVTKIILLTLWDFCSIFVRNNLSEKSSHKKLALLYIKQLLRYGLLKFKFLHTKLSYLVLDPAVRIH